jgi:hypothetical protein
MARGNFCRKAGFEAAHQDLKAVEDINDFLLDLEGRKRDIKFTSRFTPSLEGEIKGVVNCVL